MCVNSQRSIRLRLSVAGPGYTLPLPLARGGGALRTPVGNRRVATAGWRLAPAATRNVDSSCQLRTARHAHRHRSAAGVVCLARWQCGCQGLIVTVMTGDPNLRAVFLSYASQDAQAARHICESLRAAGIEVWFDQSELRGGEAWDQKIRREVRDCALFMPVISANTASRPEGYFRLEWAVADQRTQMMARNKVFIVPVCVDATAEGTADLPESFHRVQWTRLPAGAQRLPPSATGLQTCFARTPLRTRRRRNPPHYARRPHPLPQWRPLPGEAASPLSSQWRWSACSPRWPPGSISERVLPPPRSARPAVGPRLRLARRLPLRTDSRRRHTR